MLGIMTLMPGKRMLILGTRTTLLEERRPILGERTPILGERTPIPRESPPILEGRILILGERTSILGERAYHGSRLDIPVRPSSAVFFGQTRMSGLRTNTRSVMPTLCLPQSMRASCSGSEAAAIMIHPRPGAKSDPPSNVTSPSSSRWRTERNFRSRITITSPFLRAGVP